MHGLPLAFVCYRRVYVDGAWKIGTSGDELAVGSDYGEEFAPEYRLTFQSPGWYLITVQAATGGGDSRIQLIQPTAEVVNSVAQWLAPEFVQPSSITASGSGTADPTYTNLTRVWDPFEHVAIPFLIKTTTADELVKIEIETGLASSSQTFEIYVLRLHDFDQPQIENANCARGRDEIAVGSGVTATVLTYQSDLYRYTDAKRWRVAVNGVDAANALYWDFVESYTSPENTVLAAYSYSLVIKIVTTPGETVTGAVSLTVRAATAGTIHTATLSYSTTETTYTAAFLARSPGDAINQIKIAGLTVGDRFDVEVALNVTS